MRSALREFRRLSWRGFQTTINRFAGLAIPHTEPL